ncbi:MAG: sulfurtransferase-like selenium metabolism protein YedF [bacterium]|nr:sulfurtransferase-like selenium metabolism protein YedF [bacterium]
MNKEIDVRGLSCPLPVIKTKKALDEIKKGVITVIVDNIPAKENVTRLAEKEGATVEVEEKDGDFYLLIAKGDVCKISEETNEARDIVLLIDTDLFGKGEIELGNVLMRTFLHTLTEVERRPKKIIFVNNGVKLSTEGSDVLESLKKLENLGIKILSCGTCLDYYGLKDKLKVGIITNMYDIVSSLTNAEKVIKI